ncbi:hypothetical protein Hanom_Chr09g00841591 [Helianthus anomalus]
MKIAKNPKSERLYVTKKIVFDENGKHTQTSGTKILAIYSIIIYDASFITRSLEVVHFK